MQRVSKGAKGEEADVQGGSGQGGDPMHIPANQSLSKMFRVRGQS